MCHNFEPYQKWIDKRGLLGEEDVDVLLDNIQISREDLATILEIPSSEDLDMMSEDLDAVDWAVQFDHMLNEYSDSFDVELTLEIIDHLETVDLRLILSPFSSWSRRQIEAKIATLSTVSVAEEALEAMVDSISSALLPLMAKTLFWEFHCLKESQLGAEGSTEDGMLRKFIKNRFVRAEDMLAFYEKYPVIARRTTVKCVEATTHLPLKCNYTLYLFSLIVLAI